LADIENSRKLKTLGATSGKSRGAAGSRKLEIAEISRLGISRNLNGVNFARMRERANTERYEFRERFPARANFRGMTFRAPHDAGLCKEQSSDLAW